MGKAGKEAAVESEAQGQPLAAWVAFALTMAWSALLLFQIQPMLGKVLLPLLGGAPAVWITCLFFFQSALLCGYLYAHLLVRFVSLRRQWLIHLFLLLLACLVLPVTAHSSSLTREIDRPTLKILHVLTRSVGMPFVLLSATAPLLQHWWQTRYRTTPYHLYAASNAGSLVGLWIYPLLVEPRFTLASQGQSWSWGYFIFTLAILALGRAIWMAWQPAWASVNPIRDRENSIANVTPDARVDAIHVVLWIAYSLCGSVMLLATSNLLCQDIASVPFLWILPLTVYLLSFIGCFLIERIYHRGLGMVAWFLSLLVIVWMLTAGLRVYRQLSLQAAGFLFVLATVCWICHGELYRIRPAARSLTLYFLAISLGGVIGSATVTFLAPLLFSGYYEFYLAMAACLLLVLAGWRLEVVTASRPDLRLRYALRLATVSLLTFGFVALMWYAAEMSGQGRPASNAKRATLAAGRNFYGVLRVVQNDLRDPSRARVSLLHGSTTHGFQFLEESKRALPTAYFGRRSGIGVAIQAMQKQRPNTPSRWGVIGLGTGTLAAYARDGDTIRFYEINPLVVEYAEEHFGFLRDARTRGVRVEVVVGDARAELQRELDSGDRQNFDLLVMDAFSGDSVPMHLLTREAMTLYWQHVKHDALVAVQVTNRHVNLTPVVRTLAAVDGKRAVRIGLVPRSPDDPDAILGASRWMLLSENDELLGDPLISLRVDAWDVGDDRRILWTDDYSSLLPLLK